MANEVQNYAARYSLRPFNDPSMEKPAYRKFRSERVYTFDEMDEHLAKFLRERRQATGLRMADFAALVGLSTAVYGRYERAISKLTVTRLIHVCEILDITPFQMLFEAEPQMWGAETQEQRDRLEFAELSMQLPYVTVKELLAVGKRLSAIHSQTSSQENNEQSGVGQK